MKQLILLFAPLALLAAACSEDPAAPDKKGSTPGESTSEGHVKVEEIILDSDRIDIEVGGTATIGVTVLPEEAVSDNPVSYTSENPGIATVDESGMVTGITVGEAKIDVRAGGLSRVCYVEVKEAVGVYFSETIASDITFSTASLSTLLTALGIPYQSLSVAFYYIETNDNPTAEEIKQNGTCSASTVVSVPGLKQVSATVSNLAVNTRYCYVAATDINGEPFFGEVKCFTTATLPAMQEVVDMGLRVKWRGWNVGASKPEEAGNYYSWGETSFKEIYTWETYKFGEENNTLTRYVTNAPYGYNGFIDYRGTLSIDDDAATVNIGLPWRMPVYGEYVELLNHTDKKWTRYNGVYGIMMTSTINGSMLFFPAGGYRSESGSSPYGFGTIGQYWTSELNYVENTKASVLILQEQASDINMGSVADRYFGLSVRAVYN